MYFNFYAVQVKRLQALLPSRIVKYLGKDLNFVFLEIDGKPVEIEREKFRGMEKLNLLAQAIK